jgi:isopentenyl-diphosphate delta-isomerase
MNRQVVLVDEQDRELGTADIYEAHQGKGLKHRALSVILYRHMKGKIEILMQRRAKSKPVFPDLWSNTCCTNLRSGDEYLPRAVSRLKEEMGIEVKQEDLRILYRFSYEVADEVNVGWCENEVDAVMVGTSTSLSAGEFRCKLNPEEASEAKWMEYEEMKADMKNNPGIYSPWHKMIISDPRFVESCV